MSTLLGPVEGNMCDPGPKCSNEFMSIIHTALVRFVELGLIIIGRPFGAVIKNELLNDPSKVFGAVD